MSIEQKALFLTTGSTEDAEKTDNSKDYQARLDSEDRFKGI
jgi:hypothetical protein